MPRPLPQPQGRRAWPWGRPDSKPQQLSFTVTAGAGGGETGCLVATSPRPSRALGGTTWLLRAKSSVWRRGQGTPGTCPAAGPPAFPARAGCHRLYPSPACGCKRLRALPGGGCTQHSHGDTRDSPGGGDTGRPPDALAAGSRAGWGRGQGQSGRRARHLKTRGSTPDWGTHTRPEKNK